MKQNRRKACTGGRCSAETTSGCDCLKLAMKRERADLGLDSGLRGGYLIRGGGGGFILSSSLNTASQFSKDLDSKID
jgi:hypothetical protein